MTKLSWWKRALMALGVAVAALAALAGRPGAGPLGRARAGRQAQAPEFLYRGSDDVQRLPRGHRESADRPSSYADRASSGSTNS